MPALSPDDPLLDAAPRPLLTGADAAALGVRPGPGMGALLRAIYAQQLDGAVVDPAGAMAAARAWLANDPA